jgi:hypothetical protein
VDIRFSLGMLSKPVDGKYTGRKAFEGRKKEASRVAMHNDQSYTLLWA